MCWGCGPIGNDWTPSLLLSYAQRHGSLLKLKNDPRGKPESYHPNYCSDNRKNGLLAKVQRFCTCFILCLSLLPAPTSATTGVRGQSAGVPSPEAAQASRCVGVGTSAAEPPRYRRVHRSSRLVQLEDGAQDEKKAVHAQDKGPAEGAQVATGRIHGQADLLQRLHGDLPLWKLLRGVRHLPLHARSVHENGRHGAELQASFFPGKERESLSLLGEGEPPSL